MTNYDTVCMAWTHRALGEDTATGKDPKTERVWYDPHSPELPIFSYGRHFEMARVLRNKDGSFRMFLVNGDVWGTPSTARHQSTMRNAIARTGRPSLIIPYSVLGAAGITPETLEVVDLKPERTLRRTTRYDTVQGRWRWRDVDEGHYRDLTDEEREEELTKAHQRKIEKWERDQQQFAWRAMDKGDLFNYWLKGDNVFPPPRPTWEDITRNYDYQVKREVWVIDHTERRLFTAPTHGREITVHRDDDGTEWYEDTTERHVLGESLIRGSIEYVVQVKCPDCGGTGARPRVAEPNGYYLHEIEKYLAEYAEGVGQRWVHVRVDEMRERLEEDLTQQLACPKCAPARTWGRVQSRGTGRVPRRRRRTALFLSGFDVNEPRLSYFFCELPRQKGITTIEEAYEALKPDTVRVAEQMGREVVRQGDIFAIPMGALTKRDIAKLGARFERMGNLLGTNHAATEVAYLKDGRTLARGIMHHVPQDRNPDHVRVKLPKDVWHLVMKNTVPVAV